MGSRKTEVATAQDVRENAVDDGAERPVEIRHGRGKIVIRGRPYKEKCTGI
jgi:hypothetical protein